MLASGVSCEISYLILESSVLEGKVLVLLSELVLDLDGTLWWTHLKSSNGLVSQLKLLGIVIYHLSHGASELFVLLLEVGQAFSKLSDLRVILSKIVGSCTSRAGVSIG